MEIASVLVLTSFLSGSVSATYMPLESIEDCQIYREAIMEELAELAQTIGARHGEQYAEDIQLLHGVMCVEDNKLVNEEIQAEFERRLTDNIRESDSFLSISAAQGRLMGLKNKPESTPEQNQKKQARTAWDERKQRALLAEAEYKLKTMRYERAEKRYNECVAWGMSMQVCQKAFNDIYYK